MAAEPCHVSVVVLGQELLFCPFPDGTDHCFALVRDPGPEECFQSFPQEKKAFAPTLLPEGPFCLAPAGGKEDALI